MTTTRLSIEELHAIAERQRHARIMAIRDRNREALARVVAAANRRTR